MLRYLAIKNQSMGFSLVELVVVLLLVGLLSNTAVAYWRDISEQQQADLIAEKVRSALNRARLYGLNFQQPVIACGVNIQINNDCLEQNFSGIVIFIDRDQDNAFSADDTLLERVILLPNSVGGSLSKNGGAILRYRPNGALGEFGANSTVTYTSASNTQVRYITLNIAGRVYIEKGR